MTVKFKVREASSGQSANFEFPTMLHFCIFLLAQCLHDLSPSSHQSGPLFDLKYHDRDGNPVSVPFSSIPQFCMFLLSHVTFDDFTVDLSDAVSVK